MNLVLSLPVRRMLALALLGAILLLAWILLLQPAIRMMTGRQEDIVALSEQLAHLQTVIARKPDLLRQAQALKAGATATGGLWTGGSSAAVAADIQNYLRQAVSAGGGQLKSMAEEKGMVEQGFRRVTVRFDIQGTLQTVEDVLSAIETSSPFLFADNVTIIASEGNTTRERPPLLGLDLTVVGYMQAQGT